MIVRKGLLFIGGNRFGAWLSSGVCATHSRRCTGISRGPRFAGVELRGRSVGVCW